MSDKNNAGIKHSQDVTNPRWLMIHALRAVWVLFVAAVAIIGTLFIPLFTLASYFPPTTGFFEQRSVAVVVCGVSMLIGYLCAVYMCRVNTALPWLTEETK